jgi:hypothetical protein
MTVDGTKQVGAGRLLLAGLAAGFIMNAGEAALHGGMLAEAAKSAYAALNRTAVENPLHLLSLIALTFAQGVVIVWLYSAVRSRFATRFKAAACVGLTAWFLSSVYAAVYLHAGFPGIFPGELVWSPVAWQLIEIPLATLAGAAICGE